MPDTAPARHAGNRDPHGDHHPSSCPERERHFGSDVARVSHVTIPGRSLQPLCYFLGEKVTQKHFHTAAPLGRQYESAFARSAGVRNLVGTISHPLPISAGAPPSPCPYTLQLHHHRQ